MNSKLQTQPCQKKKKYFQMEFQYILKKSKIYIYIYISLLLNHKYKSYYFRSSGFTFKYLIDDNFQLFFRQKDDIIQMFINGVLF